MHRFKLSLSTCFVTWLRTQPTAWVSLGVRRILLRSINEGSFAANSFVSSWSLHSRTSIMTSIRSLRTAASATENCSNDQHNSRSAEIFPVGATSTFCYPFQVAADAMQIDIHETLYPFYAPLIMLHVHGRRKRGREGPCHPWILKFDIFLLRF